MKLARHIALAELRFLFCSPVAWAMFIVFSVQASYLYLDILESAARGGGGSKTERIFSGEHGLFENLPAFLLIYVPLLTMGVIARERQNGSIRLLQSSPATAGQIVLGKYAGLMVYCLLPISFLIGLGLFSAVFIPSFQYVPFFVALSGIFCLFAVYLAVGLFVSSLTRYQVVAAIGTMAVLFALGLLWSFGQRVPLVADIAYWFSPAARITYLTRGLLVTKDLIYFLLIVIFFLSLAFLKLSSEQRKGLLWRRFGWLFFLLIIPFVGLVTSLPRFTFFLDTTYSKVHTLSDGSHGAMFGVDGPWRVTTYINPLSNNYFLSPHLRNSLERNLFDSFLRVNPDASFAYEYFYGPTDNNRIYIRNRGRSEREIAERFAYTSRIDFSEFLEPDQIHERFDATAERFRSIMILESQGKASPIRTFNDIQFLPGELEIATAFKRIGTGAKTIAYVHGQGERRIFQKGGKNHRRRMAEESRRLSMINLGFDFEEITLEKPVPEHVDILVLAAPQNTYSPEALANFYEYLARGGNGIIYVEPGTESVVNPILGVLGMELVRGHIVQPESTHPEDLVLVAMSDDASQLGLTPFFPQADPAPPLALIGAGALKPSGESDFRLAPALEFTSSRIRFKEGVQLNIGELAPAFAFEREHAGFTQRWLAIADADFQSSAVDDSRDLAQFEAPAFTFHFAMHHWLSNGAYPVDVSRRNARDQVLKLELQQVDYIKILLYLVLPAAFLILSTGLLIARRRR